MGVVDERTQAFQMGYSYARKLVYHTWKWVIHTRNWGFRNELFIYMGVIDERKWVVQMGNSYARKLVFHIQGNELYIHENEVWEMIYSYTWGL